MQKRRLLLFGVAAAIVAAATVLGIALVSSGDKGRTFALSALLEGVSADTIGEMHLFLVRDGSAVAVFVAETPHLSGEPLWWCRMNKVFYSPFHGELFDVDGRYIAGPATRDLDRITVRVTGDTVRLDPTTVIRARGRSDGRRPLEAHGPGFRCGDPLK